jgi:predicted 3-demethylubiquinone-9 3-methyltransferase (glyoxalase superfamily)
VTDTLFICLWFARDGEAAARFYAEVFGGRVTNVLRCGPAGPHPEGEALTVEFELFGRRILALNGGTAPEHTDAMSLCVDCADQAELDRYWDALVAGGGTPVACGWIRDRWGVRWQIVPAAMPALLAGDKSGAVMTAMMGMVKLDLAALEAAAGESRE